jgi:signal transduction histidine kinase/CheY-like chemotaxis protein
VLLAGLLLTCSLIMAGGAAAARRGHAERGLLVVAVALMLTVPLTTLAVSGTTVIVVGLLFVHTVILTALSPWRPRLVARVALGGAIACGATLMLDVHAPADRLAAPPTLTGFILVAGVALTVAMVVAGRPALGASSIRGRLVSGFVALSVGAGVAAAAVSDHQIVKALSEKIGEDLHTKARSSGAAVASLLRAQVDKLAALGFSQVVQDAALARSAEASTNVAAEAELREFREAFPDHYQLAVLTLDGKLVAETGSPPAGSRVPGVWWRAAFEQAHGSPHIGLAERDAVEDAVACPIAVPFRGHDQPQLAGILVSRYRMTPAAALLALGAFGESGRVELHLPGGLQLSSDSRRVEPSDLDTIVLDALRGEHRPFTEASCGHGRCFVSASPLTPSADAPTITQLGWSIVARQGRDEALASLRAHRRTLALLVIMVGSLAATGAVLLSRRLSEPLTRLTRAAGKLATGDLSVRAGNDLGTAELSSLGQAFDRMAAALQEREAEAREAAEAKQAAEALAQTTLNALSAHVAIVDGEGTIVAVNDAWRQFARDNGADPRVGVAEGSDYLRISDAAAQSGDATAAAFSAGLRDVLGGRRGGFSLDYPCHSPTDRRWFLAHVSAFSLGGTRYAVAAHEDVTEVKTAAESLRRTAELAALRAEIGTILEAPVGAREALQRCAQALVDHLDAAFARIWTLDEPAGQLVLQASAGLYTHLDGGHARVNVGELKIGRIAAERRPHLTNDVPNDPRVSDRDWARREGMVSFAGYPLLVEDRAVGVMALFARRPLPQEVLDTLAPAAEIVAQYVQRKRAEAALLDERAMLAQRVEERTGELSRANAELARAARLKDEFLASMSHELRTPLNAILGLSEALQEEAYGPLSDRQRKSLGTIESSGRHLLDLINDILDLSKVEAGRLELQLSDVPVARLCEASLQFVKETAHRKGLKISSTVDDQLGAIVADERRIKQVLVNLLSNAVKFTPSGGRVALDARGDVAEGVVRFAVSDTGIGISAENRDRLFKPFVQIDSSLSRSYGGTGLGLALVYRLVKLHGGSVLLESTPGDGSRFTAVIPWRPVASRAEERRPEHATPAAAGRGLVLLAEDNEANIETIAGYLSVKGFKVVVARNGAEAVERARESRPDVILMDVQMPGMDGLEAMRLIRAGPGPLGAVPIVALTSLAMPGDEERCTAAGASVYMTKPIGLKRLVSVIEASRGRAHGEV